VNDKLITWSPLILLALLATLSFWLDRKVQPQARLPDGSTRHDPDFFIETGELRLHQVRLERGDASTDSFCYPS